MILNIVLALLCATVGCVDSANILLVFPAASKSHATVGRTLATGLAAKGHNCSLISPFPFAASSSTNGSVETVVLTGAIERMEGE